MMNLIGSKSSPTPRRTPVPAVLQIVVELLGAAAGSRTGGGAFVLIKNNLKVKGKGLESV